MAARTHEEFCESRHQQTTGNCHMVAECEECKEIWNAAIKSLEGVQTQPTNSRYVAALEDSYGVLNRMGGALEGCRAELAIVIERLNKG